MATNGARGRFVWYDLLTTDPSAATSFYKAIAGWGTQKWEGQPEGPPYTMWTNKDAPLGGVMPLPDQLKGAGVPPHWMAYVYTPDVDATAKRVTELGGKVLSAPMDIPTVGRFAVLQDPQGAAFAAFTSTNQPPGHEGAPEVGEFSWHELVTTDQAKAFDFYSELFGWEKAQAMDMGPLGIYQIYSRNGVMLGGMFNKTPDMPFPPNWTLYIRVPDVDAKAEEVKKLGGSVLNGPMEVPGGDRIANCMDPQGAAFSIHSVAAK